MKVLSPRNRINIRRMRGFAMNVVNVGRNNQRYPIKDLNVINNATTTQPQGAIVLLSWTPDGTVHGTIGATSAAVTQSHQKAVVLDAAGIAAGATGRVRVQGPVQVLLAANGTYSAEDPLFILDNVALGGTLTLKKSTAAGITVNTTGGVTPATAIAFVPTTIASSSTVTLGSVIFDGTDVNSVVLARDGA